MVDLYTNDALDVLEGVSGMTSVAADREAERRIVEGDVNVQELVNVVDEAGYGSSA